MNKKELLNEFWRRWHWGLRCLTHWCKVCPEMFGTADALLWLVENQATIRSQKPLRWCSAATNIPGHSSLTTGCYRAAARLWWGPARTRWPPPRRCWARRWAAPSASPRRTWRTRTPGCSCCSRSCSLQQPAPGSSTKYNVIATFKQLILTSLKKNLSFLIHLSLLFVSFVGSEP